MNDRRISRVSCICALGSPFVPRIRYRHFALLARGSKRAMACGADFVFSKKSLRSRLSRQRTAHGPGRRICQEFRIGSPTVNGHWPDAHRPASQRHGCSVEFYAKFCEMEVVHRRSRESRDDLEVVWLSDGTRPFVVVLLQTESVTSRLCRMRTWGLPARRVNGWIDCASWPRRKADC